MSQQMTNSPKLHDFDAVIFDMDGVLIDSEPLWKIAMETVFNQFNSQLTHQDFQKTVGLRIDQVIEFWNKQQNWGLSDIKGVENQILAKANATKEELAEAKSLIASLNTDIVTYRTTIEKLEGEKLVLIEEKAMVTRERDVIRKFFDSATTVIKQKEDVDRALWRRPYVYCIVIFTE